MRKFLLLTTLAATALVAAGITVQAQTYGPRMMDNDQNYANRGDCGQGYGRMGNNDDQTIGRGQGDNRGDNQDQYQDQDQGRGYGRGYHMRGYGHGMMQDEGYGRGMMQGNGYGPGMMQGDGYGRGMMQGNGYGRGMMQGNGYGPGMMRGNGNGNGPGSATGNDRSDNNQARQTLNLSVADVTSRVERWLVQQGNPRLKVGDVKEKDADTITADVVTKDNSLVDRFIVDRHTGAVDQDKSQEAAVKDTK